MRKNLILCSIPLLVLAACHAKVDVSDGDGNASGGNVRIAMGDAAGGNNSVAVDAPGFKANVSLPNIDLSGHLDLDGIKLAPDTKIGGMNVDARDSGSEGNDSGTVRVSFTNPKPPADVINHYARAAVDAGYGDIDRTATTLTAKKENKTFALELGPENGGSRGTITLSGEDTN
jgi:hypothetical protein